MLKTYSNRERRLLPVVLLAACVSATGCQSTGKQDTGMAIGAGIGAFFGYQLDDGGAAGAVAGAILGGFVGRVIGQYMDENDRREMAQTLDNNAPGEASSWDNPDTGHHYTTTPTSSVYAADGPATSTRSTSGAKCDKVELVRLGLSLHLQTLPLLRGE